MVLPKVVDDGPVAPLEEADGPSVRLLDEVMTPTRPLPQTDGDVHPPRLYTTPVRLSGDGGTSPLFSSLTV